MIGALLPIAVAILAQHGATAEELRIGAIFGTGATAAKGARVFDMWMNWTKSDQNTLGFTVVPTVLTYDAVNESFQGPILVWGGASDSIFSTNCLNKKCFGTFSVGSSYTVAGLTAIMAKASGPLTVGVIENTSPFSSSVCQGTVDFIDATHGLSMSGSKIIVTKGPLSADDLKQASTVMDSKPDVVVVCGHSGGDVEDVIMGIGNHKHRPKAILATNSITSGAAARFAERNMTDLMNCLLMPTQWAMSSAVDANVGWSSESFSAAFGEGVSYHAASAAAALLALTEARSKGGAGMLELQPGTPERQGNLSALMSAVDIQTFYGKVAFKADGSIDKPMYVQQNQGTSSPIFTSMYGAMSFPLTTCRGWGVPVTCGRVKSFYKKNKCCGMPDTPVDISTLASGGDENFAVV